MSDVLLYQTEDDGDITIPLGEDVTLANGFDTSDYLSLFGGNAGDNGTQATARMQFWGNIVEDDVALHQRSAFQALLDTSPLTSALLPRLARAAERDLQWKIDAGLVESVTVVVSVPARNRVQVTISQEIGGQVMTSRMIFPRGVTA